MFIPFADADVLQQCNFKEEYEKQQNENIVNRTERLDEISAFYQDNGFNLTHRDINYVGHGFCAFFHPNPAIKISLINSIDKTPASESVWKKCELIPCGDGIKFSGVALMSAMVQRVQPPYYDETNIPLYRSNTPDPSRTVREIKTLNTHILMPPDPFRKVREIKAENGDILMTESWIDTRSSFINQQINKDGDLCSFLVDLNIFSLIRAIDFCGIFLVTPRSDTRISHMQEFVMNWVKGIAHRRHTNPTVIYAHEMMNNNTMILDTFNSFMILMHTKIQVNSQMLSFWRLNFPPYQIPLQELKAKTGLEKDEFVTVWLKKIMGIDSYSARQVTDIIIRGIADNQYTESLRVTDIVEFAYAWIEFTHPSLHGSMMPITKLLDTTRIEELEYYDGNSNRKCKFEMGAGWKVCDDLHSINIYNWADFVRHFTVDVPASLEPWKHEMCLNVLNTMKTYLNMEDKFRCIASALNNTRLLAIFDWLMHRTDSFFSPHTENFIKQIYS